MIKNKITLVLFIGMIGFLAACNSTKSTTSKVENVADKPNKRDNNTYDLLGKSADAFKKGVETSSMFIDENNGVFKVKVGDGAQQTGQISYFMLDKVEQEIHLDKYIHKTFFKDDFSLEYVMNGERQLSYEIGPLNDVEALFYKNANGIIEVDKSKTSGKAQAELGRQEKIMAVYHTSEGFKLKKSFYPTAIKVGQSWDLKNQDLKWILSDHGSTYDASGKMILKEVIVEENDSIAIIDFNFSINFVSSLDGSPPLKKQLAFSGEIRRSLKDFIDNSVIMDGTYTIQRTKPAAGDVPELDIDIQAIGKLTIKEELIE